MGSSWCKSSPVKAVAGRPVASVAIRRVTGGCEAYTARKQAVRIQLRNLFFRGDADAVSLAEGRIRTTDKRGCSGVAGVPSPGHAFKGIPREPRRAPYLSRIMGPVTPNQKEPGPMGHEGLPQGKRTSSQRGETCRRGRPEVAARGRRAVLRAHITVEGGKPQGSRKGRPRYPLEGRGKQVDVSVWDRIHEAQNLGRYVKWN